MTYFHYYSSTSRNIADVFKYGINPALTAAAMFAMSRWCPKGDAQKEIAASWALIVSSLLYAGISSAFFGMETGDIDSNSRQAVAAELGIDPDKVRFSDYGKSGNDIVKHAYNQELGLQKWRFGTDAMFLLPIVFKSFGDRDAFHNLSHSVYGGKAAYWAAETFLVNKSGHYEIVKIAENLASTGKDISVNDLLAVYQRTREEDKKLPMIETKQEFDAVRDLLKTMADEYNKRSGFGIPEIVYLIGLNKVNIHAADGKTFSPEAVAQSKHEIERVIKLGLDGIREENKKLRIAGAQGEYKPERGFVDRLADAGFNTTQSLIRNLTGRKKLLKNEEFISVRDPGDLVTASLRR